MDLTGKMDLYIVYAFGNVKCGKTIQNEEQLKQFINDMIKARQDEINVKILDIYNNLGY